MRRPTKGTSDVLLGQDVLVPMLVGTFCADATGPTMRSADARIGLIISGEHGGEPAAPAACKLPSGGDARHGEDESSGIAQPSTALRALAPRTRWCDALGDF